MVAIRARSCSIHLRHGRRGTGSPKEMDKMVLGAEPTTHGSWPGAALGLAIVAAVVLVNVAANYVSRAGISGPPTGSSPPSSTPIRGAPAAPDRLGPGLPRGGDLALLPRQRLSADRGLPAGQGRRRHLRAAPGRRLRRLSAGGHRPGRAAPEPVAGGPPGHAQAGADDAAPLHPGLDLDRQVGRRAAPRDPRPVPAAARGEVPGLPLVRRCTRRRGKPYYECIDMALADHPQTILAYELNGEPLPIQHGAPLRLRVETKLGFKMVKFLRVDRGGGRLPHGRRRAWAGSARTSSSSTWGPRSDGPHRVRVAEGTMSPVDQGERDDASTAVRPTAAIPDMIWSPLATGGLILTIGLLGMAFGQPWLFPSSAPTAFLQGAVTEVAGVTILQHAGRAPGRPGRRPARRRPARGGQGPRGHRQPRVDRGPPGGRHTGHSMTGLGTLRPASARGRHHPPHRRGQLQATGRDALLVLIGVLLVAALGEGLRQVPDPVPAVALSSGVGQDSTARQVGRAVTIVGGESGGDMAQGRFSQAWGQTKLRAILADGPSGSQSRFPTVQGISFNTDQGIVAEGSCRHSSSRRSSSVTSSSSASVGSSGPSVASN